MDVVFICDPDYSAGAGGVIGGGSGTSTGDGGSTGGDEPTPDIPEE